MTKHPSARDDLEVALSDYYRAVGELSLDRPLPADVEVLERAQARRPRLQLLPLAVAMASCLVLGVAMLPAVMARLSGGDNGGNAGAGGTSGWVTLAPAGQGFSVSMPGAAKLTTDSIQTPAGVAAESVWTYSDGSGVQFMVVRIELPAGSLTGVAPGDVLNESVAQTMSFIPCGSLVSQSDVTLSGHFGRLFTVLGCKTMAAGELFVVGDDIYGVGFGGDTYKIDVDRTQQFLASFRITR